MQATALSTAPSGSKKPTDRVHMGRRETFRTEKFSDGRTDKFSDACPPDPPPAPKFPQKTKSAEQIPPKTNSPKKIDPETLVIHNQEPLKKKTGTEIVLYRYNDLMI